VAEVVDRSYGGPRTATNGDARRKAVGDACSGDVARQGVAGPVGVASPALTVSAVELSVAFGRCVE